MVERVLESQMRNLLHALSEALERPPRLGEVLNVLEWASLGVNPSRIELIPVLKAGVETEGGSRGGAAEVPDSLFVDASDLIRQVAEGRVPKRVTAAALAKEIYRLLDAVKPDLLDVRWETVAGLSARERRVRELTRGDLVWVPAAHGRWHVVVALEMNTFGWAMGVLLGQFQVPGVSVRLLTPALAVAFHTSLDSVVSGRWRVFGTAPQSLVGAFPSNPEIYHSPRDAWVFGADYGEFGLAEGSDGSSRLIDAAEAELVGISDGSYAQVYAPDEFERLLQRVAHGQPYP